MGLFTDLFSTKPAENAAASKISGINTGMTTANAALDTGLGQATPLYQQAYGDFSKLGAKFGGGVDAYGDATGANGQGGIDRATTAFRSMPGYQGGLDTGVNLLERRAAARGDLGGGNTSADTIKFASDYDAGKFGNYVGALAPYLGSSLSATSGGAGVLQGQAGADLGVAGQKAGIGYQGNVAIGNANADKDLAPYGASQNFWGALAGGANMALKASGVGGYAPSYGATTRGGPNGPTPFY